MRSIVKSMISIAVFVTCCDAAAKRDPFTASVKTYCHMWVKGDPAATGVSNGVSMAAGKDKTQHPMKIPHIQERNDWLNELAKQKEKVTDLVLKNGRYDRSKKLLTCDYVYEASNGQTYPQTFEVKNTQRVPI